jgi:triosephosphate isomerase (TIM)
MVERRKLIAGNWKMNGLKADGVALASDLAARMKAAGTVKFDLLVCPPFPLLFPVADAIKGSGVVLGAQNCSDKAKGAYTGDVAPAMLVDTGATYVILGHSERRNGWGETDAQIKAKAVAANEANLVTIVCVGELEAERVAGKQNAVVGAQLAGSVPDGATAANTVIAYEPVWAIGTGKTATPDDVKEMHAFIRAELVKRFADGAAFRILYGGSVNAANAEQLMAVDNVDGALVGGASLKPADFWTIAAAVK